MSHPNDLDARSLCFLKFREKFPDLKTQYIKRVIDDLNCDEEKINATLLSHSYRESKSSASSSMSPGLYSFASYNSIDSDASSPSGPLHHYKNSTELSTISAQMCDLRRLNDAFKEMENNRDYLSLETECLGEISLFRKTSPHFPSVTQLEQYERKVNERHSMLPKAMSYACDLREPNEMNTRYVGFRPPFNQNIRNHFDDGNNSKRRHSGMPDFLNPNLYPSKPRNNFLAIKKTEDKRNSLHFPDSFNLSEELVGHRPSHNRQASDPWLIECWICPQCTQNNMSFTCSFCSYDRNRSGNQ